MTQNSMTIQKNSGTIQQRPLESRRRKYYGIFRSVFTALIAVFTVSLIGIVVTCGGNIIFGNGPRLERAIANYESKKYDQAFYSLRELANKGIAKAQLYLGDCYAYGNGTMKDLKIAVKWYRAAADQDLAEAQHRMYMCYRDGIGVERNSKNAMKWFCKMLDKFNVVEQYNLCIIHDNRKGLTCEPKKNSGAGNPMR